MSRFHPYLSPPTDPQPVIIRTCCRAVIVGNPTPECVPCVIIQHAVGLCIQGRDLSLLLGKLQQFSPGALSYGTAQCFLAFSVEKMLTFNKMKLFHDLIALFVQ